MNLPRQFNYPSKISSLILSYDSNSGSLFFMQFDANSSTLLSREIRKICVQLSFRRSTAHLGSALSTVDIISVLYTMNLNFENHSSKDIKDIFLLSKGHAALALYATLYKKGIISEDELFSYALEDSIYEEHPNHKIPTVPFPTGSLGHGLSLAAGIALGKKLNGELGKVFILMSDGECNEGTVWEASQFIHSKKLSNITVLVDHNKFQATGSTDETLGSISLREVFRSFGWNSIEINGHSHKAINYAVEASSGVDQPTAIICNTIKGKGISFMENNNNWHYRSPNETELSLAMKELYQ